MKTITSLTDLTPDSENANKHTQRGGGLAAKSVQECGLGRSIVVDKNGVIIGGNQMAETVAELGIEDVEVVRSDGTKLVVVQRTDLDMAAPGPNTARKLALYDNRVAEANLDWDAKVLASLQESGAVDISDIWSETEVKTVLSAAAGSGQATGQQSSEQFLIIVDCASENEQARLLDDFIAQGLKCRALVS